MNLIDLIADLGQFAIARRDIVPNVPDV